MTRSAEPIVTPEGAQLQAISRFEVLTPTLPPATHTNVYIVGEGDLLVVDPASPYPEEQVALHDAISAHGGRVSAIFLTHQHVDHVSGATALAAATGAPIIAHPETAKRLAGNVKVDRTVEAGARLTAGPITLETIFTPGHAPGHLCLFDRASRALLCGDMVASIGTILVDADDDGDMTQYLASLTSMLALEPRPLLPSHGPPIWNAEGQLSYYIAHRGRREAKAVAALNAKGQTLAQLLPVVYADTEQALWPLAERSLKAHLVKLVTDGVAVRDGDAWKRSAA